jgi:predicted nucleic acid-binding Zn ribbon protein
MMAKRPRAVGEVLEELLQQFGLTDRLKEFDAVNCWAEVAGEQIASHTKAKDVRDGALIVEVSSSAWRNQLFYLKAELIEQINKKIGKKVIHDIMLV